MTNEEFQSLVIEKLGELTTGQNGLLSRMESLEQSVARIEHDHGEKLSALLDGYHQKSVILNRHTEQLDRIEAKIESHDIQISVLDRTKPTRRKAK